MLEDTSCILVSFEAIRRCFPTLFTSKAYGFPTTCMASCILSRSGRASFGLLEFEPGDVVEYWTLRGAGEPHLAGGAFHLGRFPKFEDASGAALNPCGGHHWLLTSEILHGLSSKSAQDRVLPKTPDPECRNAFGFSSNCQEGSGRRELVLSCAF